MFDKRKRNHMRKKLRFARLISLHLKFYKWLSGQYRNEKHYSPDFFTDGGLFLYSLKCVDVNSASGLDAPLFYGFLNLITILLAHNAYLGQYSLWIGLLIVLLVFFTVMADVGGIDACKFIRRINKAERKSPALLKRHVKEISEGDFHA